MTGDGEGASHLLYYQDKVYSINPTAHSAGPFVGLIGPPNADPGEFLKQAFGRVKNIIQPDEDPVVVHQIFLEISYAAAS